MSFNRDTGEFSFQLPDKTPAHFRISLFLVKFLSHHNRLDGIMAFLGIWWGAWTLISPGFWGAWPVTAQLAERTGGYPELLSWTLLVSGVLSYVSRRYYWTTVRSIAALAAFACWCTLTLVFLTVDPIFSPGVAIYSAAALFKLMSYVNFQIGIDQHKRGARDEHELSGPN